MSQRKNIRPLLALLVLCLFAFSITPRKTLHELFGCHSGKSEKRISTHGESLATESFHCSCDQPELQMPFIELPVFVDLFIPGFHDPEQPLPYSSPPCKTCYGFSKLRGPPAMA